MSESDLAPQIDLDELKTVIKATRQGDLLDVGKLVVLFSPDAPLHADEIEGVPHEEPLMTRETRLQPGICAIVSQTCDIQRLPDIEPYIVVAPLLNVSDKIYDDAVRGLSTRYFAYPPVEGWDERFVLNLRVVQSIEKAALVSPHVKKLPTPLSDVQRENLRTFMAARFGRPAFPDEVVRQVIEPIERAVHFVTKTPEGARVLAAAEFFGLRWTPGKSHCSVLVLLDPSKRVQHKANDPEVAAAQKQMQKKLHEYASKGDYTIKPYFRDADTLAASELLQHHELSISIDGL